MVSNSYKVLFIIYYYYLLLIYLFLSRDGVWATELRAPITLADGDHTKLGKNDSATNSSRNFLGALDTETNMLVLISDNNESLEASALTGTSLLLHGHDFKDLILELMTNKVINDLRLFDGQGVKVDFLKRFNQTFLHKSTELSYGNPSSSFFLITTSTSSTSSTTSTSVSTTESSTSSSASGWCVFACHLNYIFILKKNLKGGFYTNYFKKSKKKSPM